MSVIPKENAPAATKGVYQSEPRHSNGAPPSDRLTRSVFHPYGGAVHRQDWRDRLPDPAQYYRAHGIKLGRANATGWAQGRCPFHDDQQASLSVNLRHGGWRCFAGCGAGDLLSFHQRLTGLGFRAAVADLTGGRS